MTPNTNVWAFHSYKWCVKAPGASIMIELVGAADERIVNEGRADSFRWESSKTSTSFSCGPDSPHTAVLHIMHDVSQLLFYHIYSSTQREHRLLLTDPNTVWAERRVSTFINLIVIWLTERATNSHKTVCVWVREGAKVSRLHFQISMLEGSTWKNSSKIHKTCCDGTTIRNGI